MNPNENTISCGDSRSCHECRFLKKEEGQSRAAAARFSKNALGRCDFYDGPSHMSIKITNRWHI